MDINEPVEIEELLKQTVEVSRSTLNIDGLSDYMFIDAEGETHQFSRKQAGELLSNIDEAEEQLRSYYQNAKYNYQIVEGIISTVAITKKSKQQSALSIRNTHRADVLFAYHVGLNGFIYGERVYNVSYAMLEAWLNGLEDAGVYSIRTLNHVETARALIARYNRSQKPADKKSTLQRVIRPRIALKSFHPLVKQLVYISAASGVGIGEDKATAIVGAGYETIFDLIMATPAELEEIKGIGKVTATRLLTALGMEQKENRRRNR